LLSAYKLFGARLKPETTNNIERGSARTVSQHRYRCQRNFGEVKLLIRWSLLTGWGVQAEACAHALLPGALFFASLFDLDESGV